MPTVGNAPIVLEVPLGQQRGFAQRVRDALDHGTTVVLISLRDGAARRTLRGLGDLQPTWLAARLGGGRTATLLRVGAVPEPYAYWPRPVPEPVWRRACRACGAVDERWSWGEVAEDAPMVRQAYVLKVGKLVEVPWACPRSPACHGAPRWHRSLP